MLGAVVGDMVGSGREALAPGVKTTDFELFTPASRFSDDTVMTVAIADALLTHGRNPEGAGRTMVDKMRLWGRLYPFPGGGYGGMFNRWLRDPRPYPPPYGSWGNGAAMRVSAVGWFFETLEEVEQWAALTASLTHDHPEGIKGAQATASSVFLARAGCAPDQIRAHIAARFGYNMNRSITQIRPAYRYDVSCQGSVPEAICAALEASGFVEAVRLAVSLGGDADTLGAIAGSIAEARHPIPQPVRAEVIARLDQPLQETLAAFDAACPASIPCVGP